MSTVPTEAVHQSDMKQRRGHCDAGGAMDWTLHAFFSVGRDCIRSADHPRFAGHLASEPP